MDSLAPPASPVAPAARQLADALSGEIIDRLPLGASLPAEAELATRFAVSRVTVREALKILAGRGLVGLSRGRRAVVTQPEGEMFGAFLRSLIRSDPRAMFDLLEVRRALELQSVTLAARQASRSGIAAVGAALDAMAQAVARMPAQGYDAEADRAFVTADVRFHQAIALAGGNRVLTYLFEAMETSLQEAFEATHRGLHSDRAAAQATHDAHRAVFDHIRARDDRAAADAMLALLARAESNLRLTSGAAQDPR